VLQAEFSLTQMLDRPVSGRVFFEHVIRDNLDIGRPDQVSLVFDRRLMRTGPQATQGRFRTRRSREPGAVPVWVPAVVSLEPGAGDWALCHHWAYVPDRASA